jgi:pyridoxal phosphate enzyme (YggS family)
MTRADEIAANLRSVRERMRAALAAAGRAEDSVRLLAVSKTVAPEDIVHALTAGQLDFAENYGQEFRDKRRAVAELLAERSKQTGYAGQSELAELAELAALAALPAPRWHFIGPLQTNKVKYVAGLVVLVHTVGSDDVMAELERKAAASSLVQECLVQVNVAGETQKSGIAPADLPKMLDGFAKHAHLRCQGLMVIPPYDPDPELSRPHFAALRRLRDEHAGQARDHVTLTELSMGMSHDLEVALAEGATLIRVGTAIFGARA